MISTAALASSLAPISVADVFPRSIAGTASRALLELYCVTVNRVFRGTQTLCVATNFGKCIIMSQFCCQLF